MGSFLRKLWERGANRPQPYIAGEGCNIDPGADFLGPRENLRLGQKVTISRDAVIDARGGPIEIGDGCHVARFTVIASYPGGRIRLGHHCSVQPFCVLYGHGGLTIGNWVRIATHTVIIPANHVFDDPAAPITTQGLTKTGIVIEDDVWIGAGVRILDGVTIGHGSVIAAGAVVTKSVDALSVVGGVPAKVIGQRKMRNVS